MKLITWIFGALVLVSHPVFANQVSDPIRIEGKAAKEIIDHFPWQHINPGEGGNTYHFEGAQSGEVVIYCYKLVTGNSCEIFARIQSQDEHEITLYSPDYTWCDEESFFYKLANYIPGNGRSCGTSFDYGAVSGYTAGHLYGFIKIKLKP